MTSSTITRRDLMKWGAAVSLGVPAVSAFAQAALPKGPITLVVPFAAGGATDVVSRLVAQKLSERIARAIVVENVGGGGGSIGAAKVAKATADGSVLLMGTIATHVINPLSAGSSPYDPQRDFTPISLLAKVPNVLLVGNSVKAQNLKELIALLKSQPGKFAYGSSGVGTPPHLSGELFKAMAGVDIIHVPYKGGGPAMQGLLGGQISAYFATPVAAGPHIRAGKARALATTGATRSKLMPDMPTVAESGYPGYEATNWYAYVVPAKTPPAIIERLSRELGKVLATPEVVDLLHKQGVEPQPGTPQELGRFIQREYQTWGKVVKEAKILAN